MELVPGPRRDELGATVALLRLQWIPGAHLAAWIDQEGSAVALLWGQGRRPLPMPAQETPPEQVEKVAAGAARDVDQWLADGRDVRFVLDPHYPYQLRSVYNRPPLLFVKGHWMEPEDFRAVAVVGTRRCSDLGASRTRRLVQELVEARVTILSGLAVGIDAVAHRTAVQAGGRTGAVIGSGLDTVYPAENRSLAEGIVASGGALVSQFFPHQRPEKWTFPERNVVMSGLSLATVVVEAGETSGSRHQALAALRHGRLVFLLRSLVEHSAWARELVEQGAYGVRAVAVSSTQHIVDAIDGTGEELLAQAV